MVSKSALKEFALITFGTAVITAGVFFFMQPANLAMGSVAGLAVVLQRFVTLSVAVISLIVNIILLLLGFLLVGREFVGKTIYAALLMPILLGVLEVLLPDNTSMTNDAFVDLLCSVILISFGQAVLFGQNASSGGLDIVGKILNKFFRMDIGKSISAVGMAISLSAALVYDKKTVVLSVLGTYLSGIVLDYFIFGTNTKRKVCIISQHRQTEILDFLLDTVHSGATLYEAQGAYGGFSGKEIVTIVDKNEYRLLMNFLAKCDPAAFVTVYTVSEVLYQPKPRTQRHAEHID